MPARRSAPAWFHDFPNTIDRKVLAGDGIRRQTLSGDAEVFRARLTALASLGATEVAYQPAGPDIPRERTAFARLAGLQTGGWTYATISSMNPKVPWLPSELHPGQKAERCPRCGAIGLIPWTLRRDPTRATPVRTWVCTRCQTTEERPETD